MDVVTKIAKVAKGGGKPVPPGTPLSPADVPTEPVVITAARVIDAALDAAHDESRLRAALPPMTPVATEAEALQWLTSLRV